MIVKVGADLKVRVGSETGVDSRVGVDPRSRSKKLRVVEFEVLIDPLTFVMATLSYIIVLLSCIVAFLGAKSLLGSLGAIELRKRFF